MLAGLADVVDKATAGFEAFDYTRALEVTETFFWTFCDDYLELVKDRAYGGQGEQGAVSARAALRVALDALADGVDAAILLDTSIVLMGVRKAKSEAKTSMRTDVAVASVTGAQEALDRVEQATDDLKATGRIADLHFSPAEGPLRVAVTL